jgi:hypothetical protein
LADFLQATLDIPPKKFQTLTVKAPALDQYQKDCLPVMLDINVYLGSGAIGLVELELQKQTIHWNSTASLT